MSIRRNQARQWQKKVAVALTANTYESAHEASTPSGKHSERNSSTAICGSIVTRKRYLI